MKKNLIIPLTLLLCAVSNVYSQSKKNIREMKIKSVAVLQTDYKNNDTLVQKNTYEEYDKDGNILLEIEYFSDKTFKKKEAHKYDCHGNETDNMIFNRTGLLT